MSESVTSNEKRTNNR